MGIGKLFVGGLKLLPKGMIRPIAFRYVAGETQDAALAVVRALHGEGIRATLDVLGESARDEALVRQYVAQYKAALDAIAAEKLPAGVSVKPTALGLDVNEDLAFDSIHEVVSHAAGLGLFTRIDMENTPYTDKTIALYRRYAAETSRVGLVLQAYLKRTMADIDALADLPGGADLRLCKGIYIESADVAIKDYQGVRDNYLKLLRRIFELKFKVGIATHDQFLIDGARRLIDEMKPAEGSYEFQMLYGVRSEVARALAAEGRRVRVYVPYGRDWYPYSMRRLYENPNIAMHVTKAVAADIAGVFTGRR